LSMITVRSVYPACLGILSIIAGREPAGVDHIH